MNTKKKVTSFDYLSGYVIMAMEHANEDALKKYLKDHPEADPKNHSVQKSKSRGDTQKGPSRQIGPSGDPHHVFSASGSRSVFMGNYTSKHLQTHAQPGKGSVFSGKIQSDDVAKAISKVPASFFEGGGGAVEITVPNAGYDLVRKTSEIMKKYPNAKRITIPKQEGVEMEDGKPKKDKDGKTIPKFVNVTAYVVDNDMKDFATDKMTVVMRPANPQFMPDEAKADKDLMSAVDGGKGFAVLTAFPGNSDVPKASEWGDDYAIVVPNGGKGADTDVQKAMNQGKKASHDISAWLDAVLDPGFDPNSKIARGTPNAAQLRYQAVFMMGASGAGKGHVKGLKYLQHAGFRNLDSDEFKKLHPDYDPDQPFKVHQWSKQILESEFQKTILKGDAFVLDGTGTDGNYQRQMTQAKAQGYRIFLVYVSTPLNVSLYRNRNRNRFVQESVVMDIYARVMDSFRQLRRLADKVKVIANYDSKEEALANKDVALYPPPQERRPPRPRDPDYGVVAKTADATVDPWNAQDLLTALLGLLRAMQWNHLTSHWQIAGDTSYGDHLLFQRLYEKTVEETDGLAEKLVGTFGVLTVDAQEQSHLMSLALNRFSEMEDPVERALHFERVFQISLKLCLEELEATGQLSIGMDDLLRTMANDHETHIYLLQQRHPSVSRVASTNKNAARVRKDRAVQACQILRLAASGGMAP